MILTKNNGNQYEPAAKIIILLWLYPSIIEAQKQEYG